MFVQSMSRDGVRPLGDSRSGRFPAHPGGEAGSAVNQRACGEGHSGVSSGSPGIIGLVESRFISSQGVP